MFKFDDELKRQRFNQARTVILSMFDVEAYNRAANASMDLYALEAFYPEEYAESIEEAARARVQDLNLEVREAVIEQFLTLNGELMAEGARAWMETATDEEIVSDIGETAQRFTEDAVKRNMPEEEWSRQFHEWAQGKGDTKHPDEFIPAFMEQMTITPENSGMNDPKHREKVEAYLKDSETTIYNDIVFRVYREVAEQLGRDTAPIDGIVDDYYNLQVPIRYTFEYSRRREANLKGEETYLMNDPITNALMGRHENHITADQYFSKNAIRVKAGKKRTMWLSLTTEEQIDKAYEEYQVSDRTRYWLDALYTVAYSNPGEKIYGTDLLAKNGYSNPYDDHAIEALEDAARNISKARKTTVFVDVSNQKATRKNAVRVKATRLQPLVDGVITLEEWRTIGGRTFRDFSIELNKSPEESLPLANAAIQAGYFTTVQDSEFDFHTVRELTLNDRQMWRYILRRIKEKGTSNRILFETMFRDLDLDSGKTTIETKDDNGKVVKMKVPFREARNRIQRATIPREEKDSRLKALSAKEKKSERERNARMLAKLEKMLNEAKTDHGIDCYTKKEVTFPKKIRGWKYVRDDHMHIIGVDVVPLRAKKN